MDGSTTESASVEDGIVSELLRDGLITEQQLAQAREFQGSTGGELDQVLVKLGFVEEEELVRRIARQQRMHFVSPTDEQIDHELLARIPRQVIERHQILPLKGENGVLLALTDPNDFQAIDEVQFLTNRPVETALAPRSTIRRVIQQYYQRAEGRRRLGLKPEEKLSHELRAVVRMPQERLLKALVLTLIAKGEIDLKELLANAIRVEGELGVGPAPAAARPGSAAPAAAGDG
ncbi:MAG: hypothetical protein KatS3mg102_2509 [Planctomycetota bacterium]|nr:MAG: hypothetical protein KatS3mg102_2509 [Planctomycetota bacterium]